MRLCLYNKPDTIKGYAYRLPRPLKSPEKAMLKNSKFHNGFNSIYPILMDYPTRNRIKRPQYMKHNLKISSATWSIPRKLEQVDLFQMIQLQLPRKLEQVCPFQMIQLQLPNEGKKKSIRRTTTKHKEHEIETM